jgi:hypothetical protein
LSFGKPDFIAGFILRKMNVYHIGFFGQGMESAGRRRTVTVNAMHAGMGGHFPPFVSRRNLVTTGARIIRIEFIPSDIGTYNNKNEEESSE